MNDIRHSPRIRFKIFSTLCVVITLYILVEYTISVIYEPGRTIWPGFDDISADLGFELFEDDGALIKKMRKDLYETHPVTGAIFRTSSQGFRGSEFQAKKAEGVFRVVVLGDGLLCGLGISEEDSISSRIEQNLKETLPDRNIEVINLAVPGYTSFQGRVLAEFILPIMSPDLVVIGFGRTDGHLAPYTDSQVQASIPKPSVLFKKLDPFFGWSPIFRMVQSRFCRTTHLPMLNSSNGQAGPDNIVARVPPEELRDNLRATIDYVEQYGGRSILLNANLSNYYPEAAFKEVADELDAPYLSAREILERQLPYEPYTIDPSRRFQLHIAIQVMDLPLDEKESPRQAMLIRVPLGDIRYPPYKELILFNDNGEAGDRVAGDGISTATIQDVSSQNFEFAPCFKIIMQQNSTAQLFLNHDTFYRLPDSGNFKEKGLYYSPVYDFAKPPFHEYLLDYYDWLPNEKGAAVIAEKLATKIAETISL